MSAAATAPRVESPPPPLRQSPVRRRASAGVKRALDVAVALSLLVVTAPVIAAAALAIRLTSRGPILFRQTRIGLAGEPFPLFKLRTMTVGGDESAHRAFVAAQLGGRRRAPTADGAFKLDDDPRVTPVGAVLRRFSIDELPQLVNVLRGEMSAVGPRPSLPWEVELYTPRHRARQWVKPGLTGLWQVSGRNRLSTLDMLELDLRYLEHRTTALDLRILASTPAVVLRGDGAR
ncbi:MAG: sugar transferase [Acidimicrobiia bacterium]|nr:sugar transferase [Acidimicrobiia bacterium]